MVDLAVIAAATVLGPVLAVQVQKYLERWREENERRHSIFKVLMATRASRLAANHIEALNLIDIEFPATRKRFKKVRSAWKAYFSHLNEKPPNDMQIHPVFFAKRTELFTDMLYEMAAALGYDFDKTQISKDVYSTIYHENLEADQQTIRTKLVEILTGKASFPMAVVQFPNDLDFVKAQADYLRLMAEHLTAGKPWPIAIMGGDTSGKVIAMPSSDQTEHRSPDQATGR
jgi:hypothetical protein